MSQSPATRTGGEAGYIDAHVHLTRAEALHDLAHAGVAAVRDAGTRTGVALPLAFAPVREAVRVVTAGRALVKTGGYGAFLGIAIGTRNELAGEIRRLRDEGAGIIKVIASGVVSLEEPGAVTSGGFGADDVRFIVEEAGRRGLAVMAHANGEAAIRASAEAGVRSIEHGFFMTERALESLAARKVFWVPTVGALHRAAQQAGNPAFIEEEIDRHLVMLGRAFRAGVPLAVGTDCVLPDRRYRSCYEDELALFRRAGIPSDAVERIATEGGRKLLGI